MSDRLNVHYDAFTRTTSSAHKATAQWLWQELESRGFIYLGQHEGWYCPGEEAWIPENGVAVNADGAKVSAESGHPVVWSSEPNYKFRLSALQDELTAWLQQEPVFPAQRNAEVLSHVRAGLKDISVSRLASSVPWGIPVPGDANHTMYVWLDALSNYITAAGGPQALADGPVQWPPHVQVLGKDILRFHAVYWPAFLMAAGLQPPARLLVHAHWTAQKVKMSKSVGNVVTPEQLLDAADGHADAVRYFLLREGGIVNDGDYSPEQLQEAVHKQCRNGFGNFAARATGPGVLELPYVPAPSASLSPDDRRILDLANETVHAVRTQYDALEVPGAVRSTMHLILEANTVFANATPWRTKSTGKVPDEAAWTSTMYTALETLRVAGTLLQPVMPGTASTLLNWLGVPAQHRTLADAQVSGDGGLLDTGLPTANRGVGSAAGFLDGKSQLMLFPRPARR